MKAVIYSMMSVAFVLPCFSFDISDTIEPPYEDGFDTIDGADAVDVGEQLKKEAIDDDQGAVQGIMKAFGIDYNNTEGTDQTATFYIKEIINWVLAVLGLVALVILIYGFYKMFVAKDHEEGFTDAKKIMMNALIAITVIALAWFITSWFFRIFEVTKATVSGFIFYMIG